MNWFRNIFTGLLTAAASLIIVVGALSLALTEGFSLSAPTQEVILQTEVPVNLSITPLAPGTPSPTPQPILITATPVVATICPAPSGWQKYSVQAGDTLPDLAAQYGVSVKTLMKNNCLVTQGLLPDTVLYLPRRVPSETPVTRPPTITPIPCGPPAGWVLYLVQPGDTLFRLSTLVGVNVYQLMQANCLVGDLIRTGDRLWVPFIPIQTPRYSSTPPPTFTPIPSRTPVPPTPTRPTPTPPPTQVAPTQVKSPTHTATSLPANSPTPIPTNTLPTSIPTTAVPPTAVLPTVVSTVGNPDIYKTEIPAPSSTPNPTLTLKPDPSPVQ